MKNKYFKVNRRCSILLGIVLLVGNLMFLPSTHAEGLSDIFGAVIPPGAQPGDYYNPNWQPSPTPYSFPYPAFASTTPPVVFPSGTPVIPPGDCTTGVNHALQKLDAVASQVIPVYQQASAATGVPWEIFAAIHYIETNGGDFNPNQSLISGRPIGVPEPDQGGHVYGSLLETAIVAANVFKSAYGPGPYTDFRRLVTAFAGYNGTGNRQCFENGTPKPQTEYMGCPALFLNEDHLYPLACYDTRHENMWLVYCGDYQPCPEVSATYHGHKFSPGRVGALALIAGIQARNQPTATPPTAATPTPPAESLRYFNQCDQAFQDASFGTCFKDGQTIPLLCAAGCVPTSVSQVIASYADASYTPINAARTLIQGNLQPTPEPYLSCSGSDMIYQNQLLNTYSSSIEKGPITDSNGNLALDASRLKPFFDQGWTALARIGYTRTRYGSTVRGHYIWITRVDSNNDVWAYDPYFVNTEVMGQNAQAPINMNGLLRREYPGSDFTLIDITRFMLVRKK